MRNKVELLGRLANEPEVHHTSTGKVVTKFRLAAAKNNQSEKADFFQIVTWNKLAEACGDNLVKGQEVLIDGKLKVRSYEKNGEKRSIIEIVAREVVFLRKPKVKEELEFLE